MPIAKPTAEDEAAFMENLLSGLNDNCLEPAPTPITASQISARQKSKPSNSASHTMELGAAELASLLDGADDWDWNDMDYDMTSPRESQGVKSQRVVTQQTQTEQIATKEIYTRCIVNSISEGVVIRLDVSTDPGGEKRVVNLRDDWIATEVCIGDIINVIGTFSSEVSTIPTVTISSKSNLLILHPDLLLTATSISNAPQCVRRPLLSLLVRSTSDTTPALVWGNMLHEVVQRCLSAKRWDADFIEDMIDKVARKGLSELVKLGFSVDQAKIELQSRAKGLKTFSQRFIGNTVKGDAILSNTRSTHNTTSLLAITKLHDVEEDIWSPKYGIKGKIDAAVQVLVEERDMMAKTRASWTLPFEIKTGRAVAGMEHRAQTMMYTLLMAERYDVDVPAGLLYYTQSDEVIKVPAGRNELRALISARNEMAGYVMRRMRTADEARRHNDVNIEVAGVAEPFLPPTIDDQRVCGRCYVADACMLYRKAVENVVDETSPIAQLYELKTSHLTPKRAAFFKMWEALISLEEHDLVRFRKELWTMGARNREETGRCLSQMVLDTSYAAPDPRGLGAKDHKIHQFTYRFIRQLGHCQRCVGETGSLLNGHLLAGDPVTVSVEPRLLAFTRGFVLELTPTEVVLGVDHIITEEFVRTRSPNDDASAPIVFRIDKDELAGGMARVRDNLAQLFYVGGDTRRLELIVDLKPPAFNEERARKVSGMKSNLNVNQVQAMAKVVSADDYALILGMPGTGKTTTIAEIIRVLVHQGKSVLLTSYTHSAVDTILLKLRDSADFEILRLGNLDKIHPDVHQFTLSAKSAATTVGQLEHQILRPPVVATTCLSIDHALFTRRTFDYCIVDEASQITLPTCVGPLRFADKFILVGDHFQLPPLVRSRGARKGGLDVSLFRTLSDAHPEAVVDLAYQYRMNEDIMLISNKLIYGDRLKCGSKATAEQTLKLPKADLVRLRHESETCRQKTCWLQQLMQESCKVVFVDTDAVPAQDSRLGDLVQNEVEASLVQQITETFIDCGVHQDQIGIISLYRQQVKLLSHKLQDHKQVEVLTADRSQGRDKDCIIISLVRSNDSGQIGDLLKDWRRMNVAFTRARSKLIVIGSKKTLQAAPVLAEFIDLMQGRGWILSLPKDSHKLHDIPAPTRTAIKRPAEGDAVATKENAVVHAQKKSKKGQLNEGILRSRPVLRDLLNATKN